MNKSKNDNTDGYLDIACCTRSIVQKIMDMPSCDTESHKILIDSAKQLSMAMDSFIGEYIISSVKACRDIKNKFHKEQ